MATSRVLEMVAVVALIVGVGGILFSLTRGNGDVTVATASSSTSQEGSAATSGDGDPAASADNEQWSESNPTGLEVGSVEVRGDALVPAPDAGADGTSAEDPEIGQAAPEFTAQRFDGSSVDVNHDDQARIFLFVSHWCPNCQTQVAELSDWLRNNPLPAGVEIIAISTASKPDQDNFPASDWLADEQWPAEVVVDDADGALAAAFGVNAFPSTVVVDAAGLVSERFVGEASTDALARQASAVSRFPQGEVLDPEDTLALAMAQSTLDNECLRAAGFEAPTPTDWDWVETAGEFDVSPIVGIRRGGAAEMIGYHSVKWGGAGTIAEAGYLDSLDANAREEYSRVLSECDTNRVTNTDGANDLTALVNRRNELGAAALQDQDSAIASVVAAWRTCMVDSVGVEAESPDALGRSFAFEERPTDREREVAAADAACQLQTDFQRIYYTETAALLRLDLGPDAAIIDELAQARADEVARAKGVLAERGIEPPALDW